MNVKRSSVSILLLLALTILLTGCWDRDELEELAIVVGIGLDYIPDKDRIMVTFQIANPQVGIPNTGGDKEEPQEIVTFTAPDFLTARDLANASVARKISFAHNKVIIIGEELARSDQLLPILESSVRDREVRRDTKLLITKESAYEFVRANKPKLETRPHKFYELMMSRWEESGLVPYSTLQRYFQHTETDSSAFLAAYATSQSIESKYGDEDDYLAGQIDKMGGDRTQMIGAAVFKDGRMIGLLSGEENRIALALRPSSKANTFLTTYIDPVKSEYRVGTRMHRDEAVSYHFNIRTEPVKLSIIVPVQLEILSIPSGVNYVTDVENQRLLRDSIARALEEKYMQLIKKMQGEYQTSAFNWDLIVRRQFWTLDAFSAFDWQKKFTEAEIDVTVKASLQNFGKQLDPTK